MVHIIFRCSHNPIKTVVNKRKRNSGAGANYVDLDSCQASRSIILPSQDYNDDFDFISDGKRQRFEGLMPEVVSFRMGDGDVNE